MKKKKNRSAARLAIRSGCFMLLLPLAIMTMFCSAYGLFALVRTGQGASAPYATIIAVILLASLVLIGYATYRSGADLARRMRWFTGIQRERNRLATLEHETPPESAVRVFDDETTGSADANRR